MGSGCGKGTSRCKGVLLSELGASGFAMVNLPMENGCSIEEREMRRVGSAGGCGGGGVCGSSEVEGGICTSTLGGETLF